MWRLYARTVGSCSLTADSDLRLQIRDRIHEEISLYALYRTFNPTPYIPRGVTLVGGLISAAASGWARISARHSQKVVLGVSADHVYMFGATSRIAGWRLTEEIGRASKKTCTCLRLDGEPNGLLITLPGLEEPVAMYPLYDTPEAREIRRFLC